MVDASAELIDVVVCWSGQPRQVHEHSLRVPAGSTVQSATAQLMAQGLPDVSPAELARLPGLQPGIWGRKVAWSQALQSGDRIELYRELQVDPKVARRQRFKRQGKGRTGLFANRKPGSAAGY